MVRGLISAEETHQDRASASDRPADCVGCPIDSVGIEERGLFDGDGVFRRALWSGHVRGLCVGEMGRSVGSRALYPVE